MMAYDETPESSDEPWSARSFGEERTLWEDSLAVFGSLVGADRQPDAVEEMARLVGEGVLSASALLDVDAYGLDSSRAKIDLWRHERQPLPLRYLGDDELVDSLHQCLELTEQVHKSLYGATRELAEEALTAGVRDADRDAVSRMVAALDVAGYYWSSLELPFRELIVDLAAEGTDRFEREAQWVALLRRTAWQAFGQAESGLAPNARSLRAISHARRVLGGSLKKKLADYEEVTAHAD
jgi:CRISPR system Cascade subunit CasA